MTVADGPGGTTRLTSRVVARAARQALIGTGLRVESAHLEDRTARLVISAAAHAGKKEVGELLDERLGYGFWIDLGLADHTPVFDIRRPR